MSGTTQAKKLQVDQEGIGGCLALVHENQHLILVNRIKIIFITYLNDRFLHPLSSVVSDNQKTRYVLSLFQYLDNLYWSPERPQVLFYTGFTLLESQWKQM